MSDMTLTMPARAPSNVAALGSFEARRFLRSWPFWVGLALTVLQAATVDLDHEEWAGSAYQNFTGMSWPTTYVGAFVAAVLIGSRDRLDPAIPLSATTPVDGASRTAARLMGGSALVAVSAVAASLSWVYLKASGGIFVAGDRITPSVVEIALVPVTVALAVACGIAASQFLGRAVLIVGGSLLILITTVAGWIFGPAIDVLPAALYLPRDIDLPADFDPATAPASWILEAPSSDEPNWQRVSFELPSVGMHLVYVAGLAVVVSAIAVRAHGRHRIARVLGVIGVTATLVGGVGQYLVRSW